jgi:PEP-CTERM motif
MKTLSRFALAAALLGSMASANALSTFGDNGGVHQALEVAGGLFFGGVDDKYSFELASAATLTSDIIAAGAPSISGKVSLWADSVVDKLIGYYDFSAGSHSFGALSAGDYHYTVEGKSGVGGYLLESKMVVAAVPEPATYALMLAGLGALAFAAKRRKQ